MHTTKGDPPSSIRQSKGTPPPPYASQRDPPSSIRQSKGTPPPPYASQLHMCYSTTDQFPENARGSIRQNKRGEYYQDFYKLVHSFCTPLLVVLYLVNSLRHFVGLRIHWLAPSLPSHISIPSFPSTHHISIPSFPSTHHISIPSFPSTHHISIPSFPSTPSLPTPPLTTSRVIVDADGSQQESSTILLAIKRSFLSPSFKCTGELVYHAPLMCPAHVPH